MAQDRGEWLAVVNHCNELLGFIKLGNSLTVCGAVSSRRRVLWDWISYSFHQSTSLVTGIATAIFNKSIVQAVLGESIGDVIVYDVSVLLLFCCRST